MMIDGIIETKDEICKIVELGTDDPGFWNINEQDVTSIKAYDDGGKPWLAIFNGEKIISRIAADRMVIFYA